MNRKIVLLPLVAAGLILAGCGPTEETSSSSSSSKSESTGTSVSTGTTESSETTDATLVETGKLGLWQTNLGEAQYFTGRMGDGNQSYYFGTTTDFEAAATINVRSVENGLTLQIGDGQYIAARLSGDGEHNNIIMQDEAYTWSYNEEYDAYYTNLGGSDLWIGNSQKFTTISLNEWKWIDKAGNNVAHVVQSAITAPEGGETGGSSEDSSSSESTGTTDPTLVETGKLGLWQTNLGEAQYFTGRMGEGNQSYYFGTTTDFEAAATINVRSVENGLTLQIGDGQYIAARLSGDGEHNNIIMQDEAYTWSYNEEYDAYYTNLGGSDLWIGNSQKFTTISLNEWKWIDKAGNNVAHVVQSAITAPEGGETGGSSSSEETTLTPTDKVPENNQVIGVERASTPKGFYYWTGEMDGRYLKTTTVFAEAAKLTFEAVTGGFAIKVADNSYLNAVAGKSSWEMELSSNKGVWSLSEEGALITDINGKGYYLGAYDTYTTMSLSGYSHFGGNGNYAAELFATEPAAN